MKLNRLIGVAWLVLGLSTAGISVPSWAKTYYVTPAEAEAMINKAISALEENETAALEAFSDSGSGFVDRELFIMCFNTKTGKITAPNNPSFSNTDIRTMKGLGQKFYDAATTLSEEGTFTQINYEYPMREGGEPVSKEMFVTRVGNQGCGTMLFDRSKTD